MGNVSMPAWQECHAAVGLLNNVAGAWQGARFVGYDAKDGVWRFEVEHFSRYGLLDSDDDEPEKGPGEGGAGVGGEGGDQRVPEIEEDAISIQAMQERRSGCCRSCAAVGGLRACMCRSGRSL